MRLSHLHPLFFLFFVVVVSPRAIFQQTWSMDSIRKALDFLVISPSKPNQSQNKEY